MPRKPSITPNKHLHTTIPADLAARLDLFLWSEAEGRVPQGAYQSFICDSIRDFFNKRTIDVAPYIPSATIGQYLITGTPETLRAIITHLQGANAS
jgi:hypothetical protein